MSYFTLPITELEVRASIQVLDLPTLLYVAPLAGVSEQALSVSRHFDRRVLQD